MSVEPPMDRVFNIGPFPIGGDSDTVCQTAYLSDNPYHNNAWAPTLPKTCLTHRPKKLDQDRKWLKGEMLRLENAAEHLRREVAEIISI